MQRFSAWERPRDPSPFANLLKALLDPQGLDDHENMTSLLRLARRPEVGLPDFDYCGQNCQLGVVAIAQVTLQAYIYLSVIGYLPAEQWQKIQMSECNSRIVLTIIASYNFNTQRLSHQPF